MALFKQIFANDPDNPQNVAENGVISLFAPGTRDLILITSVTGEALANPLELNSRGFGPPFDAPGYVQVAWEAVTPGEVFQGTFESYEGILAQATAAKVEAAEGAATELAQRIATGEFNGSDGLPGKDGANVATTRDAVASELEDPASPSRAVLSATIASLPLPKPSGGDDHATLQAILNASATFGFETLAPGNVEYKLSTSLVFRTGAKLRGRGHSSKFSLLPNANCAVFTNADHANGNAGIMLHDVYGEANRLDQTGQLSVADFSRVTYSSFKKLKLRGGKRMEIYPAGNKGEGLELTRCSWNDVDGIYALDCDYDAVKLRSSHWNTIDHVFSQNNGKGGMQFAYAYGTDEYLYENSSTHNTASNIIVHHTTGIPQNPDVSPQTTGVTFHSAAHNTVTNLIVYGTQYGISTAGGDVSVRNNAVHGGLIETRTVDRCLALNAGTSNTYTLLVVRPISGENKQFFGIGGSRNTLSHCTFEIGGGTGVWTDVVYGQSFENSLIWNMHDSSATYGGLTDNGVQTYIMERSRRGNYGFGMTQGFGSATGVMGIRNASTAPTQPLANNGSSLLYSEGGALKGWSAGGTLSLLAGDYVAPTGPYNLPHNVRIVVASGSSVNLGTLPAAHKGRIVTVKNIGATATTVQTDGGSLIDGVATRSLAQWQSANFLFTGTNWLIV